MVDTEGFAPRVRQDERRFKDYVRIAMETLPSEVSGLLPLYLLRNPGIDSMLQEDPYRFSKNPVEGILAESALRAEERAYRDPLTGAWNGRLLEDIVPFYFNRAVRDYAENGRGLSVAVVDLIGLKYRNDSIGREEGDDAIRILARLLNSTNRQDDLVARLGDAADEFAVVMPGANRRVAERYVNDLKEKLAFVAVSPPIEIYSGIGSYDPGVSSPTELLEMASREMNIAKSRLSHPLARK